MDSRLNVPNDGRLNGHRSPQDNLTATKNGSLLADGHLALIPVVLNIAFPIALMQEYPFPYQEFLLSNIKSEIQTTGYVQYIIKV